MVAVAHRRYIGTVRFYVRLGLLQPGVSAKDGGRPYQVFIAEHLHAAKIIRTARSLGMSLKEIAAISKERRAGRMTRDRRVEVLTVQRAKLELKATELATMQGYLHARVRSF